VWSADGAQLTSNQFLRVRHFRSIIENTLVMLPQVQERITRLAQFRHDQIFGWQRRPTRFRYAAGYKGCWDLSGSLLPPHPSDIRAQRRDADLDAVSFQTIADRFQGMALLACNVDLRPKGTDLCGLALWLSLAQSGEAVLKAFVPRLNFKIRRHYTAVYGKIIHNSMVFGSFCDILQFAAGCGIGGARQHGRMAAKGW